MVVLLALIGVLFLALALSDGFNGLHNWSMIVTEQVTHAGCWALVMLAALGVVGLVIWVSLGSELGGIFGGGFAP